MTTQARTVSALPRVFENDLMVDSAVHLLKNRPSATIYELCPRPISSR